MLKELCQIRWEWSFHGILCLGSIALAADSSQCRKMALEEGLLSFISFEHSGLDSNPDPFTETYTWTCRVASAIALNQIYHLKKNESFGLLAHASLSARQKVEKNASVLEYLCISPIHAQRLSFLFKYSNKLLAESYLNHQTNVSDMRKFLKTAQRQTKNNNLIQKQNQKQLMQIQNELRGLSLSVEPYHSNYKKAPLHRATSFGHAAILAKSSSLSGSYSCVKSIPMAAHPNADKPDAGNPNRRKLFDAYSKQESLPKRGDTMKSLDDQESYKGCLIVFIFIDYVR